MFEPVNNGVYGTCNLQRRCVRSTHARDMLNKFFGRQALAEYVDVSSGNVRHKLYVSYKNVA